MLWLRSQSVHKFKGGNVGQQTAELFKKVVRKTFKLNYLQYVPEGVSKKKKLPLVLFLHGAGERGNDLAKLVKHGPPKLVEEGKEFQFVLISPQCPKDTWWRPDALIELVDETVEKFPIDEQRIYVTGLSMGGTVLGPWRESIPRVLLRLRQSVAEAHVNMHAELLKHKYLFGLSMAQKIRLFRLRNRNVWLLLSKNLDGQRI